MTSQSEPTPQPDSTLLPDTTPEPSARPPRPPWSAFQAALRGAGFHPSRRLGQNFLLDENLARAIARDAKLEPGDQVMEVGPGCGFLSVHLAHEDIDLLAIEIDPRLAPIAAQFLEPYDRARVLECDILNGKHALNPEVLAELPEGSTPWYLVSNLPYAVSAPVLALVAEQPKPAKTFTVLVQQEVADRLAASPATSQWGPLSASIQLTYDVTLGRPVPPGAFWPRPRVDSRIVHGTVRTDLLPTVERLAVRDLARALMGRRRQMVRRVLGDLMGDKEAAAARLEAAGIDGDVRTGALNLEQLTRLADTPG
jgi:16S rRNA (adenine1518-N6/adenine1519-N6)-dimethyltransferase